MSTKPEVFKRDKRGRMRLTVLRKVGQYGPFYSALVYRNRKTSQDGENPTFEETHWLDEQDILNARRLHDIADQLISDAKEADARDSRQQEAA